MVKQTLTLDPAAQAYTDNQIVAKVNAATDPITRLGFTDLDVIDEGTTNKHFTAGDLLKLEGVEDGATADQTGGEVRDLIVGLSDTARKIVITEPAQGEYKVIGVQRDATGKIKVSYDDVPIP